MASTKPVLSSCFILFYFSDCMLLFYYLQNRVAWMEYCYRQNFPLALLNYYSDSTSDMKRHTTIPNSTALPSFFIIIPPMFNHSWAVCHKSVTQRAGLKSRSLAAAGRRNLSCKMLATHMNVNTSNGQWESCRATVACTVRGGIKGVFMCE